MVKKMQTNPAGSEGEDGFPADFLIVLDRSRSRGLRVQLEHALREAIRLGRLPSGSTMPPSRGNSLMMSAVSAGLQTAKCFSERLPLFWWYRRKITGVISRFTSVRRTDFLRTTASASVSSPENSV